MTPEMLAKIRQSLIAHEDYRRLPYVDSVGKITIGIGYNLTDRGLSDDWINHQFEADVSYFYNQLLSDFAWFRQLNVDRQIVLVDMAFMGYKHFLSFKKMIAALAEKDYHQAAIEMLDSKWADQVKGRATQLASAMITGVYNL